MKRILGKVFVFALLTVLTVNVLNYMLYKFNKSSIYSSGDYNWVASLNRKPRIVIMGTSSVLYNLDPSAIADEMNLPPGSVVVLASNGRTPVGAYYLYKSIQSCLDSADVVFYGIDPFLFSEKYYVNDNLYPVLWSPAKRIKIAWSDQYQGYKALLGGDLLRNISKIADNSFDKPVVMPENYGAKTLNRKPRNFSGPLKPLFDFENFDVSGEYIHYLGMLRDEVEKSGKPFVLYLPPKTRAWVDDYSANCIDFDEVFRKQLTEEMGSVRVAGSFNAIPVAVQDSCFNDDIHLNAYGQKVLSRIFAKSYQEYVNVQPSSIRRLLRY